MLFMLFMLFTLFVHVKSSCKKRFKISPNTLIYYTTDVYPLPPLPPLTCFMIIISGGLFFMGIFSVYENLFLFLSSVGIFSFYENLFLFMIICKNLFLFIIICESLSLFMINYFITYFLSHLPICAYLFSSPFIIHNLFSFVCI